jgi:hypothetical protein
LIVGEFMSTTMKGRVHENPHDRKKLKKSSPPDKTYSVSLTWENSTDLHPLDIAAHSPRVVTEVHVSVGNQVVVN